jgi:hypothetical protein
VRAITPLLLTLLLAGSARAGDDGGAAALLETLVRQAIVGPEADGPSPTRVVADLLREDPAALRRALGEAWAVRPLLGWNAARALEEAGRMLHGLSADGKAPFGARPSGSGLWEESGVILVRLVATGERWDGPFRGEDVPPFDEALAGRSLRAPPRPDPGALRAVLAGGAPAFRGESELLSLFLALGETAREDAALRAELLARARAEPRDRFLAVALGALGGPEAAALLRDRFLAATPREYRRRARFLELGRLLARVDPGGPRAALGTLRGEDLTRALDAAGPELVLPDVLRALEEAPGDLARRGALEEIASIVSSRGSRGVPTALRPGLFRALVSFLDGEDDPGRQLALHAAKGILAYCHPFPVSSRFGTDEGSVSEQGRAIGASGGLEHLLRTLDADLSAGRLVPLPDRLDPWRAPPAFLDPGPEPVAADGSRAHADVPCPLPGLSGPDPRFPIHASAEPVEDGWRLTIRNAGPRPFLVNPVALRYAEASVTTIRVRREGELTLSGRQLFLELGFIRGRFAVPASELRPVAPGGTFTWTVRVLPEHRDARFLAIELHHVPVLGRPSLPVLLSMGKSWIR